MASVAEEIIDDLVTAGLITAKGTDGFHTHLPDVSPLSVLVRRTGGLPHSSYPAPQLAMLFRVRGVANDTTGAAEVLAADIFNRYHSSGHTLTSYTVLMAIGQGMPAPLGEDENMREQYDFVMNFQVAKTDQTSGSTTGYGGYKDPNT